MKDSPELCVTNIKTYIVPCARNFLLEVRVVSPRTLRVAEEEESHHLYVALSYQENLDQQRFQTIGLLVYNHPRQHCSN